MTRSFTVALIFALCLAQTLSVSIGGGASRPSFSSSAPRMSSSMPSMRPSSPSPISRPSMSSPISRPSIPSPISRPSLPSPISRPTIPSHKPTAGAPISRPAAPSPISRPPTFSHKPATPSPISRPTIPSHKPTVGAPISRPNIPSHKPSVPSPTQRPTTPSTKPVTHPAVKPTPKPTHPTPQPIRPLSPPPRPAANPTTHPTPRPQPAQPAKPNGVQTPSNVYQMNPAWKNLKLGNGDATIGHGGCAISSLAAMAGKAGIKIEGAAPNTLSMNNWLKANGGFQGSNVKWDAMSKLGLRYTGDINGSNKAGISQALGQGKSAVLNVGTADRPHYVYATGADATGYSVVDPGHQYRNHYNFEQVRFAKIYGQ